MILIYRKKSFICGLYDKERESMVSNDVWERERENIYSLYAGVSFFIILDTATTSTASLNILALYCTLAVKRLPDVS